MGRAGRVARRVQIGACGSQASFQDLSTLAETSRPVRHDGRDDRAARLRRIFRPGCRWSCDGRRWRRCGCGRRWRLGWVWVRRCRRHCRRAALFGFRPHGESVLARGAEVFGSGVAVQDDLRVRRRSLGRSLAVWAMQPAAPLPEHRAYRRYCLCRVERERRGARLPVRARDMLRDVGLQTQGRRQLFDEHGVGFQQRRWRQLLPGPSSGRRAGLCRVGPAVHVW